MKPFLSLALLASTAALGACATTSGSGSAESSEASSHERLFAAFAAADEADLKLNPLDALSRGDMRYADHFGDYDSDAYHSAQKRDAEANLAALGGIERDSLSPTDRIAYDVFEWNQKRTLASLADDLLPLTEVRPVNHYASWQVYYPSIASGQGAAPFETLADYENNLKRNAEYVAWIDRAIGRMREGLASGVVESRLTTQRTIEQLDEQIAAGVEGSVFYGPVKQFPKDFSEADKARLTAAYRTDIEGILAADRRLRDFLKSDYLPQTHEVPGLLAMKGGDKVYRQLIEEYTTLPLDPEEVHQTGLREVARILEAMKETQRELGFEGTLQDYFTWVRTAPRFKRTTKQEKVDAFNRISKMVEAKAPDYFLHLPKLPLEVRPVEPFREKYAAEASYNEGSPDGSRPGVFYYSTYDLPARTAPNEITLYMHEAEPGHHFQISLAMENTALPNFMRFGGNTAFVEGWALYAETLGYDMGFYDDPASRFGTLNDEMLRALRLVVDTGIHAKGWSREQAIQYMTDNSALSLVEIRTEVERYIAMPGQALAYKIGALTIQRLRAKAEQELGDRFDIREFHDQVLNTGSLPLPILENKIDAWIAAKRG